MFFKYTYLFVVNKKQFTFSYRNLIMNISEFKINLIFLTLYLVSYLIFNIINTNIEIITEI